MTNLQQPSFRISPGLIVGVVVGLLIGLLIGWVIWPVEWQGAQLSELYPEAKADYLVAVAEAYAMYGSPEAAAVARQRVAGFGDGLSAELESAIAEVSKRSDPDKAVRISNLHSLAAALDVALPNLVGFTQADQQATTVTTPAANLTPTVAPLPPPAEPASSGASWLGWLFGLLVAVVLVLGGVYSLLLFSRRNAQTPADPPIETVIDDHFAALKGDDAGADTTSTRYVAPPYPGEPEEYQFDDDPEDFSGFPAVSAGALRTPAGHFTQFSLDSEQGDPRQRADSVDDDFWDDDDEQDEDDATNGNVEQGSLADGARTLAGAAAGVDGQRSTRPANASIQTAPGAPTGQMDLAARPTTFGRNGSRFKQLEIYTAQFQAGIRDYEETHTITDPSTGKYIGECGMGVSTKNGLLNRSGEVVALEVWIFDKTDEKNIGNQSRVLLSEYAIDHNLDQVFLKERQDDPRPFTAQPNVRFQLENQNLLLDCTITEAIYIPSGPTKGTFQSVTVEMSVNKKL